MEKEKIIDALKKMCDKTRINFKEKDKWVNHLLIYNSSIRKEKEFLDLDEKNIKGYIDLRCNKIKEQSNEINDILKQINKHYRLSFLYYVKDFLTEEEFNKMLRNSWMITKLPNLERKRKLFELFERSKKELLMTKEELDKFNSLPQIIIIYRGLQGDKSKIKGLSWTLSKRRAERFANNWRTGGKIYQAEINKEDIFMYTNIRHEKEVIVNPYRLSKIKRGIL